MRANTLYQGGNNEVVYWDGNGTIKENINAMLIIVPFELKDQIMSYPINSRAVFFAEHPRLTFVKLSSILKTLYFKENKASLGIGKDTHLSHAVTVKRGVMVGNNCFLDEGVVLGVLTAPLEMLGDKKGNVVGLKCQKMELGEKVASGRRRPIPIPDSEFIFPVDTVIIAIGQRPNQLIAQTTSGLETTKWGTFVHDEETGKTTQDRIFCGGDVATGAATVILAMEAGRKAAKAIHEMILERDLQ